MCRRCSRRRQTRARQWKRVVAKVILVQKLRSAWAATGQALTTRKWQTESGSHRESQCLAETATGLGSVSTSVHIVVDHAAKVVAIAAVATWHIPSTTSLCEAHHPLDNREEIAPDPETGDSTGPPRRRFNCQSIPPPRNMEKTSHQLLAKQAQNS